MLGYAGWYDSHDGYTTFMFYMPWEFGLAPGPAYYLYFRSLTNQEFDWRQTWHLLPGLGQGRARPYPWPHSTTWGGCAVDSTGRFRITSAP